ncbi:MAG: GNAT family N-acetyltransferase [Ilumatobacteraceae bacterium]
MRPVLTAALDVREHTGSDVLDLLGVRFDELADRLEVPLTSQRPWLTAWISAYPSCRPRVIGAWDGQELVGACLLAERDVGPGVEIVNLGHGRNDRSHLLAGEDAVADALAAGIARRLRALGCPWSLRIEQVAPGDPVATALVARLPEVSIVAGGSVPGVDFMRDRAVGTHLSKNLRRQLQKSRNRIATDGLDLTMEFTRARHQLLAQMDEIESVHRTRDHDVGRTSDIDDAAGRHLWRTVVASAIERDQVEIATLRIDGVLVAYVISFLDRSTYRVFDGRFVTQWARYSPGRLLEVETLTRALGDERFTSLDWMNSIAPDKLISANMLEPTVHVIGSSPPA